MPHPAAALPPLGSAAARTRAQPLFASTFLTHRVLAGAARLHYRGEGPAAPPASRSSTARRLAAISPRPRRRRSPTRASSASSRGLVPLTTRARSRAHSRRRGCLPTSGLLSVSWAPTRRATLARCSRARATASSRRAPRDPNFSRVRTCRRRHPLRRARARPHGRRRASCTAASRSTSPPSTAPPSSTRSSRGSPPTSRPRRRRGRPIRRVQVG